MAAGTSMRAPRSSSRARAPASTRSWYPTIPTRSSGHSSTRNRVLGTLSEGCESFGPVTRGRLEKFDTIFLAFPFPTYHIRTKVMILLFLIWKDGGEIPFSLPPFPSLYFSLRLPFTHLNEFMDPACRK